MNRKILLFAFIIGLFAMACNDGDMEVESISFENSDILSCRANDTAVDFLYKYNQKQALYLTIPAGVLENKEKTVTGTIPNNYKLYYRTFSDVVSSKRVLEHQAVVFSQSLLFGGYVDFAVGIKIVQVAQSNAGLVGEALRPSAVYDRTFKVRMEQINQNFHDKTP